jgi:dienelactone hydrolase
MSFEAVRYQVSFATSSSRLGADLVIPAGNGPHAAAVLVGASSGPRDRRRWTEALAFLGLATLSWDSPGWGASPGVRRWQAPDERTMEVVAAVEFLRGVRDVVPHRVALIGSDCGSWSAALAATLSSQVAALVMLAPACTGVFSQELTRLGQRLHGLGFISAEVSLAQFVLSERIRRLVAGEDPRSVVTAEAPCRLAPWYGWLPGVTAEELAAFSTLPGYRAATLLPLVRCPVLGVFGTDDPATGAWENADLLRQAFLASPGRDHQIFVLPRSDAAFTAGQDAPVGSGFPGDWHDELIVSVTDWLAPRLAPGVPATPPGAIPRAG